jgi:3(or 17)beta-hydroxysteroid dehydrogenase
MSLKRVDKKTAIITGGAQGIGFACAKLLHDEGAFVFISDVNQTKGIEAAKAIGNRCEFFLQDVSSEQGWDALFKAVIQKAGRVDILVNNAGISGLSEGFGPQDPEHLSLKDWKKVQAINAEGTFLGCKYAIMHMKNHGGSIINMCSRSANVGIPTMSAYAASKATIRNHTKSVALYCCEQGYPIRCNSVHPAAIKTPFWDPMFQKDLKKEQSTREQIPMGHMGEPIDVAYAVIYLASDESKFVTGAELLVDGGILAGSAAPPGIIHSKENI